MSVTIEFPKIWARQGRGSRLKAFTDRGSLELGSFGLRFRGRRGEVLLSQPALAGITVAERGPIRWLAVRDRATGQEILFADGRWLGWRGSLGGTERLADELRRAGVAAE
jgi:hypothetical protein